MMSIASLRSWSNQAIDWSRTWIRFFAAWPACVEPFSRNERFQFSRLQAWAVHHLGRLLMPTRESIDDPEHWHNRADEIRALAKDMADATAEAIMLRIAEDYEKLAKRAKQRAWGK